MVNFKAMVINPGYDSSSSASSDSSSSTLSSASPSDERSRSPRRDTRRGRTGSTCVIASGAGSAASASGVAIGSYMAGSGQSRRSVAIGSRAARSGGGSSGSSSVAIASGAGSAAVSGSGSAFASGAGSAAATSGSVRVRNVFGGAGRHDAAAAAAARATGERTGARVLDLQFAEDVCVVIRTAGGCEYPLMQAAGDRQRAAQDAEEHAALPPASQIKLTIETGDNRDGAVLVTLRRRPECVAVESELVAQRVKMDVGALAVHGNVASATFTGSGSMSVHGDVTHISHTGTGNVDVHGAATGNVWHRGVGVITHN